MRALICCTLIAFSFSSVLAGPSSTRPASSRPTTTQPVSPSLNKYYNLLKTEFMHDKDGNIVMVTEDTTALIEKIRAWALFEKRLLERQLKEAASQKAALKNSPRSRGEGVAPGDWAGRRRLMYEYRVLANNQHSSGPQWTDKDVADMKKRLKLLAPLTSPNYHKLPPKAYWTRLSPDQQEQLSRVGITPSEFKATLERLGWTEESFAALAQRLEADRRPVDEVATTLRAEIENRMKRPSSRPSAPVSGR